MMVHGAPVRAVRLGSGETQPGHVALRPSETVVRGAAGMGSLSFHCGLGAVAPAIPEPPWLAVYRVGRAGDGRAVLLLPEDHPGPTPRMGWGGSLVWRTGGFHRRENA
jgi:hypothetical protein